MNPFILCPGGPNGSSAAQIELREQILERREEGTNALVSGGLGQDDRRWRGGVRRGHVHLRRSFQGARRALADAPGAAHPLGGRRATAGPPLSFYAASGGSKGCAQAHEKLGDGAAGHCGDGSAKRTARRARHAWEWRVGGCGRAQGQGLGGRHARSTAALPTWPPMVAKCSGVMALHLLAIRGAPGSPRAEI